MRKKINKVTFFICNLFVALIIMVLLDKFIGFRMQVFSWQEIGYDFYLYVIGSIGFAAWVTWGGVGDNLIDFFANRRKKKRINKTSEDSKNENK